MKTGAMTEQELEEIMLEWRGVFRCATDPWAIQFARSILRHAKRPEWRPSAKQAGMMRRMIAEVRRARPDPETDLLSHCDDPVLIEADQ